MKRLGAKNWLGIQYRRSLYGGWTREDDTTAPPHKKAILFHEAAKALFCPHCSDYLGQIGSDRSETWTCKTCSKTAILPPHDTEAGDWLLAGPSFSKHFPLTLNPYFEQAMAHRIVDEIKNQQKCTTQYILDNGDRVHCLSYEQFLKAGKDTTNPFEGPRWKGALFDEPPPRGVWVATKRGLLKWTSKYTKPPFAQAYLTIGVFGGNQSLLSGTLVWSYDDQRYVRIEEIREPLRVLGWNGSALVPAMAYPYPAKPRADLLRVRMRSGRAFVATPGHRVLDAQGRWRRVGGLAPGDRLLGLDPEPWCLSLAPSPQAGDATTCVQTGSGIPTSSPAAGLASRSSDDERWRTSGAPRRTAEVHDATDSSADVHAFHHGMRSDHFQASDQPPWSLFRVSGIASRSFGCGSQVALPPTGGFGLHLQPSLESAQQATLDQDAPSLSPAEMEIESITTVSAEVNYDLWVPGVESFLAEGVIHHNSSKSYTSRSEFCSNIVGVRPWDDSLSIHYGRAIIAATPLESPWLFHDIYQKAWNKGGDEKTIFAIEFDITDNPALTDKAIKQFAMGLSPEEEEARLHGRFKHLSGRIFPEWDPSVHVYEPSQFNPLYNGYSPVGHEPSPIPLAMGCDPHYRRPWMMVWLAVMPDGSICVVREWPNEPFERMKNSRLGFDDYKRIISEVESTFPGGGDRVLWREFDPHLANTPHQQAVGSTTILQEMRKRDLYFRADVNDKIHFGHSLIHTLLRYDQTQPVSATNRPKLIVSSECRNLLYAFENYTWDERMDQDWDKPLRDKPKESGKDAIDALRYALVREPTYMDWRTCVGGLEGHYSQAVEELETW